jgi:acyl-CoA thioester hydrolase
MQEGSVLELRIDWSEMDMFGHVNNVSFFKYVQAARVNLWPKLGIEATKPPNPLGVMLASCNCTFLKPVFYPGHIRIHTYVEHIGNSSFGFYHRVLNADGDLCAEAHDVMVLYDFAREVKAGITGGMRSRMEAFVLTKET